MSSAVVDTCCAVLDKRGGNNFFPELSACLQRRKALDDFFLPFLPVVLTLEIWESANDSCSLKKKKSRITPKSERLSSLKIHLLWMPTWHCWLNSTGENCKMQQASASPPGTEQESVTVHLWTLYVVKKCWLAQGQTDTWFTGTTDPKTHTSHP